MRKLKAELGNVVLEVVFGILLFGGFLFPLTAEVWDFAKTKITVREASYNIARSWALSSNTNQNQTTSELIDWYKNRKQFQISVSCAPDCEHQRASVLVKVVAPKSFGFFGIVSEITRLERDFYAE